jgi:hypothetical protein
MSENPNLAINTSFSPEKTVNDRETPLALSPKSVRIRLFRMESKTDRNNRQFSKEINMRSY